jgi:D-3-phosphoglycerate dehydrogenase
VGGSTEEAQQDIGNFVAGKLRDYVADGNTSLSVNLPPVTLPREPGQSRLLLLHVNTPGVLATVNGLLAEHGVNIDGQLLSTRGSLGYVVTDIAGEPSADVIVALQGLPETVQLRVLT